jgi:hypothetical protein
LYRTREVRLPQSSHLSFRIVQSEAKNLSVGRPAGFKPGTVDGKRHKLNVKLADAVKNQHKGVRLRYRLAYVPIGHNDWDQSGHESQRGGTRK